jgi:hypothetical protein
MTVAKLFCEPAKNVLYRRRKYRRPQAHCVKFTPRMLNLAPPLCSEVFRSIRTVGFSYPP